MVDRFNMIFKEEKFGDYVLYEDYAKLEAQFTELNKHYQDLHLEYDLYKRGLNSKQSRTRPSGIGSGD